MKIPLFNKICSVAIALMGVISNLIGLFSDTKTIEFVVVAIFVLLIGVEDDE